MCIYIYNLTPQDFYVVLLSPSELSASVKLLLQVTLHFYMIGQYNRYSKVPTSSNYILNYSYIMSLAILNFKNI